MRNTIRLADFIRAKMEPILQSWEAFAQTLLHGSNMDKSGLRDHAKEMLLEIADDLESNQSEGERAAKSKGKGPRNQEKSWAEVHGGARQISGFSVMETVSEFRALRASVVALWAQAYPAVSGQQFEDLTRFHEAIDQAVAESLEQYATVKEMETRLFGAILVASPDPIYVLDIPGRFVYANQAAVRLFAVEPESILGKTPFELGFSFAADLQSDVKKVMAEQRTYRGRFVYTFASVRGERFEYVLAPVLDEQDQTEAAVCILRDVTERELAEEKVWHNAHHDLLTGLPNRRLFLDRLKQEIKHAKRSGRPVAVLFMDLDGFKQVNDSLGHEAGDRLLADVAERLAGSVREGDTIARLGGDEFTLIVTGASRRADIERVARTVIDTLTEPFEIMNQPVPISVSIGISIYPQDATTPAALLGTADQAMYKTKQSGTSQMCFYSQADETDTGKS